MPATFVMQRLRFWSALSLLALASGCSDGESSAKPTYGGRGRVASTQGGAVVMTYDERIAVAVHRTAGFISVVRLNPAAAADAVVRGVTEIDLGVDAEPWAAVIGADDDSAYVLLRGSQEVIRIDGLHDRPAIAAGSAVQVGNEPTAIAITPSGSRLYIANWANGTVSMITTSNMVAQQRTDLNLVLAQTGALGPGTLDSLPGGTPIWTDEELASRRPGFAHPRALAMTDDGDADDGDETLFVTDFFSQPIPGADPSDPDGARQGVVYAISVATGQVLAPIFLAPVSTGFFDAKDSATQCFPNQLYAAAAAQGRVFVTSVCASPRGPIGPGPKATPDAAASPANFQTMVHPVVFVLDGATGQPMPWQNSVLSRALQDRYDQDPSITERRFPLIPNDIAVLPGPNGGTRAFVTALGADAVFPVTFTTSEAVPDPHFVNLRPSGRLPVGVAASRSGRFALVANDGSDSLSVLDLAAGTAPARVDPLLGERGDPAVREGRRNFATGLDVWSFKGQAWSSCESCHPEGLSDGLTWQFPRGPRRTLSTAGTYAPDGQTRRMLLWTANADEVHDVEAIARGTSGGVGAVLWKGYTANKPNKNCRLLYDGSTFGPADLDADISDCPKPELTTLRLNGLNGSLSAITRADGVTACAPDASRCDISATPDWDHIDDFIRSVRAPRAPKPCTSSALGFGPACLDADEVEKGRKLFEEYRCTGCHGGPSFTISRVFYTPNTLNSGAVPYDKLDPPMDPPDPRGWLGALRTDRYDAGPLAELNPPAKTTGSAPFRSYAPAEVSDTVTHPVFDWVYGTSDQVNCVLRAVGTFPPQPAATTEDPMPTPNFAGPSAPFGPAVDESRETIPSTDPTKYTRTLALGKDGFNVPSLVGLGVAGSFFHGGNARTLEEALGTTFSAHYLSSAFGTSAPLGAEQVRSLTSYLLSLDDDSDVLSVAPTLDGFNADLCAQFVDRR